MSRLKSIFMWVIVENLSECSAIIVKSSIPKLLQGLYFQERLS